MLKTLINIINMAKKTVVASNDEARKVLVTTQDGEVVQEFTIEQLAEAYALAGENGYQVNI